MKLIYFQIGSNSKLLVIWGNPASPQGELLANLIEYDQLLNLAPKGDLLLGAQQRHPADVAHVGAQQISAMAAI